MSLIALAHLLLGTALLLALGFHRHRAAQFALLLWLMLGAIDLGDPRILDGALRFGSWLLLGCAVMPEPRLLSRRHALLATTILVLTAITLDAPHDLFAALRDAAAWPLGDLGAAAAAAVLGFAAAVVCLVRWGLEGRPLEFGLTVTLALAAIGCARLDAAAGWFAAAASVALGTILYSSYRMAFIDQLTGLPNRRALDETLSRLSGHYALAMIDVDHFKSFNDTYGHDAGDVVLKEVARNLRRHAGGRAFRYGGEEFCVVYGGASSEQAAEQLERARERIEAQKIAVAAPARKSRGRKQDTRAAAPRTTDVSVTVSGGCAPRDAQRRIATDVLKAADRALYKAKDKGRNRIVRA